jgi:hypothetical protein
MCYCAIHINILIFYYIIFKILIYYIMKSKKASSKISNSLKIKPSQKISIPIDWDSRDHGYSALSSSKVYKFILKNLSEGNNLIQTQHNKSFKPKGKTVLKLQAVKFKSWKLSPKWENNKSGNFIQCKDFNEFIKTTPCNTGKKRSKIFLKFKSNKKVAGFGTYLLRIYSGDIDEKKHSQFVKAIKKTFKNSSVIIHNEDMDWFHMKALV